MIKTVIKRNGETQVFEPSKLNGWGIWASQNLGKHVDWIGAVLHTVSTSNEVTPTRELQESLIKYCLRKPSWAYNRMAGRLYISLVYKDLYDGKIPTIRNCFKQLVDAKIMAPEFFNAFSEVDYIELEKIIDHSADLNMAHYQIAQTLDKYSLKDRVDDRLYETPQFSMMRVAMRMCMNKGTGKARIARIKRHYNQYKKDTVNIPTPYFTNSGTKRSGFLSCCLHTNIDTLQSLSTSNHISYMMTATSAGIGQKSYTRAQGDKVRGGSIEHSGRINYNKAEVAMIQANMQNGRGGAETQFFDCIDVESIAIIPMKNPMTPAAKQVRGLDYGFCYNTFFMEKVANEEDYYLFSYGDHPELFDEMCSKTPENYEALYNKAVAGGKFRLKINARDLMMQILTESVEVGQMYLVDLSEMNIHTPFKEAIRQSNLCLEIKLVTKPYRHITELYKDHYDEGDGEVAVCAISGISVGKFGDLTPEEYEEAYAEAAWVSLDMIHTAITETDYPFPQVAFTAKARMNAGVGIVDLAHWMAMNKKSYLDQEGRDFIHETAERHYWHLLNASLELSKEFGNAKWMHKTLWPEGWLPIDTYNKNVDSIVTCGTVYDWESKRKEVIANGGHAFSTLVAHMPAEKSSIKAGTTNGIYQIRDINLKKTDDHEAYSYVVPDSDTLIDYYEIVWNSDIEDIAKKYGIVQKWTDQTISADVWYKIQGNDSISSHDLLRGVMAFKRYGVPTRYYLNSLTGKGKSLQKNDVIINNDVEEVETGDCAGCKL